ncbi:unnamed protein product [Closterium sp. NIES-54]
MAAKVLLHPLTHWVIDSGSSWHMTHRADLLDEIQPAPISTVTSATGAKVKVMGMGCAKLIGADGELLGLKNVLWTPDLCANLISTGQLGDASVNTETIGSERYRAYNDERLIWDLQRKGDVHKADHGPPLAEIGQGGSRGIYEGECHRGGAARCARRGADSRKCSGKGAGYLGPSKLGDLALAARTRGCFYIGGDAQGEGSAKAPLEVVHMDLVGPMRTEGTGGVLYFLTMVDEWSRFTWARPLSKKSDAAATIKEDWLSMVERESMRLVKVLRSYRGGEFLGAEFTKFLKRNGIRHQLTCPGTPKQNGIAERANRTIGKVAKSMLGADGMPYKFWPDAVRHVITVKNRVLTHVGDRHWVPYECWLGKKPSIDMRWVWGCMGLVMVPNKQRHKLEVVAVHDVMFVEDVMYKDWQQQQQQQQQQVHIGLRLQEIERSAVEEVQLHLEDLFGSELTSDHIGGGERQGAGPAAEEGLEDESARMDSPSQTEPAATAKVTKRSAMAVQADEGDDEETAIRFFTPLPGEPATFEEALSGPQKEEWKAAMNA